MGESTEHVEMTITPVEKECVWCDRMFGVFGVLMGLAILYIGVDVLLGGKVTNVLSLSGGEDD